MSKIKYFSGLFLVLLFMILMLSSASALILNDHTIFIKVSNDDDQAKVSVEETFLFKLQSQLDLDRFIETTNSYGKEATKWKEFDTSVEELLIEPHVAGLDINPENINFSRIEDGQNLYSVLLTYDLNSSIIEEDEIVVNSEKQKVNVLSQTIYTFPVVSGRYVLPKETNFKIMLPRNSQVISLTPTPTENRGNEFVWSNINRAPNVTFKFVAPIVPKLSVQKFIQDTIAYLNNTQLIYVVLIVLIVLGAVVYLRKEDLKDSVQSYVIKHSRYERDEESDEEV